MAIIHPLASVHPGARLADSVEVGPYAFIDDNVEIGEGTKILPHATIFSYVKIGRDCNVFPGAVVGAIPQDLKFDGEVTYYKYHPGKFLMAINPKSSTDNERNTIVLKDKKGREILVRQIAGFVARRIVCDLKAGDEAIAGEELGMIRFGSRVDVFLPLDAEVKVRMNHRTVGKETVLAVLN